MTVLENDARYKPLDFGADGITGSIDQNGRIIALNSYHPQHGYVTLTSAPPFPETERYNPATVRQYRADLVNLEGFGLQFDSERIQRRTVSWKGAIPVLNLRFDSGREAELRMFAVDGGAIQKWQMGGGAAIDWGGRFSLQRCAYTQLTEGGPVPMPPVKTHACFKDGMLTLENPALECAVVVAGLPAGDAWEQDADGPLSVRLKCQAGNSLFAYGFGSTVDIARMNTLRLAENAEGYFYQAQTRWNHDLADDPPLQRGLTYSAMMAVPVGEGICLLTDHMILPLSWNRDAYYIARALLGWQPEMTNLVRRHLFWMFEQAERRDSLWGRCYLANGGIKDGAFQLDQQLFPLLELAEYVLETHDQTTYERLKPHIGLLLEGLHKRQHPGRMLFPTDETPADDPITLPYHLSSHVLFWRVARLLHQLGIESMATMADLLRREIDRTFIAYHGGQRMYAYASDGRQKYHFYHDANDIPLALMPFWGLVSAEDPVWRATVAFAFSDQNPGAYNGHLGSVHTRAAWPLGDVQELIVARALGDAAREQQVRNRLARVAQWDGALPEAYDPATGDVVSRHWFAWPNAALACFERGVFSS